MTTNNYKAELDLAVALHEVAVKERDLARAEVERLRAERDAALKRIVELDEVREAQGELLSKLPPSADQLVMAEMDAAVARTERDEARADLREAMELLRAHGQAPSWLLSAGKFGAVKDWNRRYGELLEKHKETP